MMDRFIIEARHQNALIRLQSVVALPIAALVLVSCSSVPDYANPVEWYKSTAEFVVGTDEGAEDETRLDEEAEAHAEDSFPSLADTPNPAGRAPTVEEMEGVREGLAADKDHARYTDGVIRRESQEELLIAAAPKSSLPETTVAAQQAIPREPKSVAPQNETGPTRSTTPKSRPVPTSLMPVPSQERQPLPVTNIQPRAPELRVAQPMTDATGGNVMAGVENAGGAPVDVVARFKSLFSASGSRASVNPDGSEPWNLGTIASASGTTAPSGAINGVPHPAISMQAGVITFRSGSATLPKGAINIVQEAAKLHRERGGTVRVVGHASSRTRELTLERHKLANFSVSMDRAKVVADQLVRAGVDPGVIFISAVGDQEPIFHEWMPSGESENQRAEIYLDY